MSKIVIIGAGAMGSAFAVPCLDNNHDVNIIGTHLENESIDNLKKNKNLHPGLNTKIHEEIKHELNQAVKFAKSSPHPKILNMKKYVYA